ncbi:antibiotic biosynthesis monooxygenase [Nocardia sp. NBC_00881]|uniref:putative quinol monooxygenase n=1 Tax=Nocardia sp. NBC_00881 TaxID=2975995 RepID=UPI00386D4559|nr:antibiotic biosynthesis monooxygenase [Nocardia sp. NBC_00881]
MSTLTLNVRFTAEPGCEADLKELLQSMIEPTLAEEGCLGYELYLHPTDPRRVVLLEEWVDADALATHFQTPHLKACAAALEGILVEPFELRRFAEIA